jgi:hypothetical protein
MTQPVEKPSELSHMPAKSKFLLLLGAATAVGIILFSTLWNGAENRSKSADGRANHGAACPYLYEASARFHNGDLPSFSKLVRYGAIAAEATLNRSEQVFGVPERIAVRLSLALKSSRISGSRITTYLDEAQGACSKLGLWSPAPTPARSK